MNMDTIVNIFHFVLSQNDMSFFMGVGGLHFMLTMDIMDTTRLMRFEKAIMVLRFYCRLLSVL